LLPTRLHMAFINEGVMSAKSDNKNASSLRLDCMMRGIERRKAYIA